MGVNFKTLILREKKSAEGIIWFYERACKRRADKIT
jgi:hypothetical protein